MPLSPNGESHDITESKRCQFSLSGPFSPSGETMVIGESIELYTVLAYTVLAIKQSIHQTVVS